MKQELDPVSSVERGVGAVNRELLKNSAVMVGLVAVAVITRLLITEPNVHAVTAAALFAGFYFRSRLTAACVPLLAMTASNWVLGGYTKEVMVAVYASLVLPIAWRGVLRSKLSVTRVGGVAVTSSIAFFVITNAAVWDAGRWYPHTWDGLVRCYTAALPFFTNALIGDAIFSGALFGAYALVTRLSAASSPALTLSTARATA